MRKLFGGINHEHAAMVQSFIFNLNTKVGEKSPETYYLWMKHSSFIRILTPTHIQQVTQEIYSN
jgi:hypothetical protein